MLNETKNIERYLKKLSPDLLGLKTIDSVQILNQTPGSYNLNFHIRVNQTDFNFRINIDQQSGLSNQIEYEYRVLKFLEGRHIGPRAFLFDDTCKDFDFGIMIQQYLKGPYLTQAPRDITCAAELLSRLHALKPVGTHFVIWQDPLVDTYKLVQDDFNGYASKRNCDKHLLNMAKKCLKELKPRVRIHRGRYHPESLNHTDMGLDNFIQSPDGLRLIDWEKPRIDDNTYDMCCFLSEPAALWCVPKVLNKQKRQQFIETYARLSQKDKTDLMTKIKIREPLVSLHWILWGATKLCDLKNMSTSPKLVEAHKKNAVRYQRIARKEHIEKILDSLEQNFSDVQ
jgi:thiamine kinase-like enzyme